MMSVVLVSNYARHSCVKQALVGDVCVCVFGPWLHVCTGADAPLVRLTSLTEKGAALHLVVEELLA